MSFPPAIAPLRAAVRRVFSRSLEPHADRAPRLVFRFAVHTAIVLVLAALGTLWFVRHETTARAERAVVFHVRFVAGSILRHRLAPADFARPVTGARRAELDALSLARFSLRGRVA